MTKPNRHLTRQAVFQAVFESDFRGNDASENFNRIASELNGDIDVKFGLSIIKAINENGVDIDHKLLEAAPDWPIEKVARVDKAILRISLAELFYNPDVEVPNRVAINEAVELAKKFGSDSSKSFVNGVLGTIHRKYIAKTDES